MVRFLSLIQAATVISAARSRRMVTNLSTLNQSTAIAKCRYSAFRQRGIFFSKWFSQNFRKLAGGPEIDKERSRKTRYSGQKKHCREKCQAYVRNHLRESGGYGDTMRDFSGGCGGLWGHNTRFWGNGVIWGNGNGVSDCLGKSSCLWCAPWLAIPEHGVEDDQELAHGGGERELLGFAGRDQALGRRRAARGCGGPRPGPPCRAPPAPAPGRPRWCAGPSSGRCRGRTADPDQRGDGSAVELAELGQQSRAGWPR